MLSIINFIVISFKRVFAYRFSVISGLIGSLISIFAQFALWSYIFRGNSKMTEYMLVYVVISRILKQLYENNISLMISQRVLKGDYTYDLLKPIRPIYGYLGMGIGQNLGQFSINGLVILISLGSFLRGIALDSTMLFLVLSNIVLSIALVNLMYALIGYVAFVTTEVWPFVRILNDSIKLLSGALIPLSFYPSQLGNICEILPFKYIYYYPIQMITSQISVIEAIWSTLILLTWVGGVFLLTISIDNKLINKATAFGG